MIISCGVDTDALKVGVVLQYASSRTTSLRELRKEALSRLLGGRKKRQRKRNHSREAALEGGLPPQRLH